ncbi:Serpin peptidase inhibitor, clade B (Ovalbumin), member [Chamberlinius hualienensis]
MHIKNSFKVIIIIIIFTCGCSLVQSHEKICSKNGGIACLVSQLSKSQLYFSFKFYKALNKSGYNPAISPFSLGLSLAMVHAGAKGETKNELNGLLEFHNFTDKNDVNRAYKKVINTMWKSNDENVTLSVGNRMLVSNSATISLHYSRITKRCYRSHIESVDFVTNKTTVTSKINRWINKQTRGKIRNVVDSNSFNQFTKMVLINAIYFKGKWIKTFDIASTYKSNFMLDSKSNTTVEMMSTRNYFYFTESSYLNCTMLALDYLYDRVTMYILLPKEIEGLASLENNITPDVFISLKNSLKRQEIWLFVPKFRSDKVKLPMMDTLRHLGVDSATSYSADFSGIFSNGSNNLALTDFNHHVHLNVDEYGTEAAGVTEFKFHFLSAVKRLRIDHPFLYIIYDKVNNMVLFMGRVTFPKVD